MKKKIKLIAILLIVIIVVTIAIITTIRIINDDTKLTVDEKKWINTNLSTVQNVNVLNNVDVFGNNGYGVFFDFIKDFSDEYGIKVNPITYNHLDSNPEEGFKLTNTIDNNSVVFYNDYYIVIGKNYENIRNINDLNSKEIAVLESDISYLSSYLKDAKLKTYKTYKEIEEAFQKEDNSLNYMLVPRTLYTGYTIKNNYNIIYHLGDIKIYFIYQMNPEKTFSHIIKKYFNEWSDKKLNNSINNNLLSTFTTNLNLSEKDLSDLTSKVYNYGFINNSPYEVLLSGKYGGIVSEYLNKFSDFTGIEFKYTKYKNYNAFYSAIANGKVDIYFNYYKTINEFKTIDTGMNINYVVLAKNSNNLVVNSLSSLRGKTIYVLENSVISEYLSSLSNIEMKTYKNNSELEKIAKKDNIIIMDRETYNYMSNKELKEYNIRYSGITNNTYNFKINTDDAFYRLFNGYVMTQDPENIRISGLYNHEKTLKTGSFLGTIAQYILYIIIAASLLVYILYRSSKKIKISKKIKKEDKIRFIDELTSLKNRNYLNENIEGWNKNTIYPQATVVVDLNRVQEINDTKGYDEGDKQIKAAANILIRTQLDNSDVMRTDGNEFLIYLVGYDKKSIESYIRKLIKEFKKLPYDYSATIGYSMITDDLKTIEDAINESVDDMKEKKKEV